MYQPLPRTDGMTPPSSKKPRPVVEVVINKSHAPFCLSETLNRRLIKARVPGVVRQADGSVSYTDLSRSNPTLVSLVKSLGTLAAGPRAELRVVRVPGDSCWRLQAMLTGYEYLIDQDSRRLG